MLKHICTTGVLCLFAMLSFAQQVITIQVTNEKNDNLVGATVTLDGQAQQTDASGTVKLTIKDRKNNNITVRYVGMKTFQSTLNAGQASLLVQLLPAMIQAEEILVSATRAKENSATTYTNIDKETISKRNLGQDIPYLLDQTPGVVIGSDAGAGIGYTNMTIRGSDNQRINVTLNGIPLNDAESMGSFFVNLPDFASSTQSIQIQRGIGTSTNGAGAFGASLNIQTDELQDHPYVEFNNTFGSYNSWKNTLKVGSGLINNKFAFNTRLSRISSDGYIDRAFSNLKSFYVDGGYFSNKHTLKATVFSGKEKTYQAWYGTPEPILTGDKTLLSKYANEAFGLYDGTEFDRLMNGDRKYNYYTYDNQTDNYTQTHSHLHYSYQASHNFKLNTALHYTRGAGYYEEYRENDKLSKYNLENVVIGGENISKSDLIRRRWLDNHFYGLTYSLHYEPTSKWNLIWGGGFNQYRGDHYGEVIWSRYASNSELGDKYYFNDAEKNDFNTYIKVDHKIDKWLFNLDIQYRHINYRIDGDDDKIKNIDLKDNLNFLNPKIGATYFLNSSSNIYVSYAYASKEPVRKDYVENPRAEFPKPEKMQDIEAGYRYRTPKLNIGANLYAMLYKDQLIPTGSLNDTGGELRMNIPKSHRIGVEVDASWMISDHFIWAATAALSDNRIKNFVEYYQVYEDDINWNYIGERTQEHGDTKIAKSASTILSNNLTYKPIQNLSFSLLSKYVSRLYLDNTSRKEKSIAPSFVNNLQGTYSFTALGIKQIDLNLMINNIFNSNYSTNGYTWGQQFENRTNRDYYNFYYPQASTNFLLGLNISF